jgi:aminoacyl-tRNA hydrolase
MERLGLRAAPGLIAIPLSRSGFVLPDGYMNDSGQIVFRAVERWRPTAEGLLIVHDDLDLPLAEVRQRNGGGHGGHNGLRDIIARLGSGAFQRLSIGIGRPPGATDPADYVLSTFRPEEREPIDHAVDRAAALIVQFVDAAANAGAPVRQHHCRGADRTAETYPRGYIGSSPAWEIRVVLLDLVQSGPRDHQGAEAPATTGIDQPDEQATSGSVSSSRYAIHNSSSPPMALIAGSASSSPAQTVNRAQATRGAASDQ